MDRVKVNRVIHRLNQLFVILLVVKLLCDLPRLHVIFGVGGKDILVEVVLRIDALSSSQKS